MIRGSNGIGDADSLRVAGFFFLSSDSARFSAGVEFANAAA